MDFEFDRENNLKSIPQRFGIENALRIAFIAHGLMILFLVVLLQFVDELGILYLVGVIIVAGLLTYEHSLVRPGDLTKNKYCIF